MSQTPFQRLRRASAALLAGTAGALLLAAPAVADYPVGWYVQIEDSISLGPSHLKPDSIMAGGFAPEPGSTQGYAAFATVLRDGLVVAGGQPWRHAELADLRNGDVIVLRDGADPSQPELIRWTYQKKLGVDEPICAGAASYGGSRHAGATDLYGSTARWVPAEPYPSYPGYPSYGVSYPTSIYPGGSYGWQALDASFATVTPVGADRLKFVPGRPTLGGMRLTIGESFRPLPKLSVFLWATQSVISCDDGAPTPAPKPTPLPGPAPTPAPTTPPVIPGKDTKPPTAALAGLTNAKLKAGGRRSLINKGLPFTLTVDEPGRLVGTVKLVTGKKSKLLKKVDSPLKAGKNALRLKWNKAGKRRLRAASPKAKLKLALTVIDAAGNKRALGPITVKLPR